MSLEDIARRNEEMPGYDLVDYAEIALPVWQLSLEAISVAHQRISPIQEFVLRAFAAGLCAEDAAGFLGLAAEHVEGAIGQLSFDRLIRSQDVETGHYVVSDEGAHVLEEGTLSVPIEDQFSIMFDGIKRSLIEVPAEQLAFPRDTETGSLVEIAAVPPKKPTAADLDAGELERFMVRLARSPQDFGRHILRLKRISRHRRLFRRAVALVFKGSLNSKDLRVKFIVGGVRAEDLEQRFAAGGGLSSAGFVKAFSNAYLQANLRQHLGQEISNAVLDLEEYRVRQRAVSVAKLRSSSSDRKLRMVESGELAPSGAPSVDELERVRNGLRSALENLGAARVRPAAVYEQAEFLFTALKGAKRSLLISSRTLSPIFVTQEFKSGLGALLGRKVNVEIRLDRETYDKTRDVAHIQRLYADLQKLANRNGNLKVHFVNEKRYYFIAVDELKMLVSNRPVLSNHLRQRTFEQFSGYFIQDSQLIAAYLNRVGRFS